MKEKNTQTLIIAVLAVAVLVMAVGFAGYSQNLNISGNTTLSAASWDVHFDTTSLSETTGTSYVTGVNPTVTGTNVTYSVTLANPGDKYEFTVNAINEGTFDAALKSITISPTLSDDDLKNLAITVDYNGTQYVADASHGTYTISGVTLPKKSGSTAGSHTIKVTTEYKVVSSTDDLLDADMTQDISITFAYEQA